MRRGVRTINAGEAGFPFFSVLFMIFLANMVMGLFLVEQLGFQLAQTMLQVIFHSIELLNLNSLRSVVLYPN
jgi:hypothetical protein